MWSALQTPLSDDCHHSGSDSGSHCGVCGDLAIVACTASAVSGQVPAECTKDGILWLEDWTLYWCDSTSLFRCTIYTVETTNNGHVGIKYFREVSLSLEYWYNKLEASECVLHREVLYSECPYQRFSVPFLLGEYVHIQ